MVIAFPYEKQPSPAFGTVYRPVADAYLQNIKTSQWQPVTMLVDSGADYSFFPFWYTVPLGIDLVRDCRRETTFGVGGAVNVYYFEALNVRVGPWERAIPVGFLAQPDIPPLLGRQGFLDTFTVVLSKRQVYFTEQTPSFDE